MRLYKLKSLPDSLITAVFTFFILSFPLLFLNLTFEPAEHSKLLSLILICSLLLSLISLNILKVKKVTLVKSTYAIPLILITAFYLLSSILVSPNIFLTLNTSQSTSSWLALLFLYLTLTGFFSFNDRFRKTTLILISAGTSLVALYQYLMYLRYIPFNLILPTGNLLSSAVFFSVVIILTIANLTVLISKEKDNLVQTIKKNIILLLSLVILIPADMLLILHLLSDQKPILLPHTIAYSIVGQIINHPKTFLLGVGPSNFISAFTLGKPLSINYSSLWNITFTSSSSFFTTLITETGILNGIIFLSVAVISIWRVRKFRYLDRFPALFGLNILLILLIIFPGSLSLLILLVILLSLSADANNKKTVSLKRIGPLIYFLPVLSIFISFLIIYFTARAYLAESFYRLSYNYLDKNDGTNAYNYQRKAVSLNPYIDKYHLALSQSSIILADAMGKKKDLSQDQKQMIPKLAQQSIEEGRMSISLNKTNVFNWDNLSKIYSALINFAADSDRWAIETAKQKVTLDPKNPNNWLNLALIYNKLENYDDAEKSLLRAIELKNDLPGLHYQLGLVYKNKNNLGKARSYFEKALNMLPEDSPDYIKVEMELKTFASP